MSKRRVAHVSHCLIAACVIVLQACALLLLSSGCTPPLLSGYPQPGADSDGAGMLAGSAIGADGTGTMALSTPYAFVFPTAGMLGWAYGRDGHKGIDVWTGNFCGPQWKSPPGNAVYLAYGGKLAYWLVDTLNGAAPKQVKTLSAAKGVCVGLVFEHVDPLPDAAHSGAKLYTVYMHLATDSTGVSTVDPRFLGQSAWGVTYPKGTYLGRQGDRRYDRSDPNESVITHLHFATFKNKDGVLRTTDYVNPSPYFGLTVQYGSASSLPAGSEFQAVPTGGASYVVPALKPSYGTIAAKGGTLSFTAVSIPCGSALKSSAAWVSALRLTERIDDASGAAVRTVSATVGANKTASNRNVTVTVGQLVYLLTQSGAAKNGS